MAKQTRLGGVDVFERSSEEGTLMSDRAIGYLVAAEVCALFWIAIGMLVLGSI